MYPLWLLLGLVGWCLGETPTPIEPPKGTRTPVGPLLQEARNLTVRNSACGRQELCAYRKNKNDGLLAPGLLNLTRFLQNPCYCDLPTCMDFGDCCADLMETRWNQTRPKEVRGRPAELWQCRRLGPPQKATMQQQHAWMVGSCSSTSDPSVSRGCSAQPEELGDEYTYVHDVPVLVNGTLYRNVFCAACFDFSPEELTPLTLEMRCSSSNVTDEQVQSGRYVAGALRWGLPTGEWCELSIRELSRLEEFNSLQMAESGASSPPLRQCRPSLERCPEHWEDQEVAAKCLAYALYVYQNAKQPVTVYKNPHCGLCHNASLPLSCELALHASSRTPDKAVPASFSVIFHFSLGGDVVGQRACAAGFVWDPLFRRCQPVFTCEQDSRYKLGQCPEDEESRNLVTSAGRDASSGGSNRTSCDRVVLQPHEFEVLDNGSLLLGRTGDVLDQEVFHFNGDNAEVCASEVSAAVAEEGGGEAEFSGLQGMLTLVCTCISLLGLALHVAILLALPRLRNLPGLISMATSLALFAAQALFLWATGAHRPAHFPSCLSLAALLHFCFLKVFSWTSVMSYDIWRTFTHPTGHVSGSRRSHSQRAQFIRYVMFATLFPASIVLLSVLLDLTAPSLPISPAYATQSSLCWFGSRAGLGLLFAAPVCLLLITNLLLYGVVVLRIHEQRQAARFLVESAATSQPQRRYTESDCKLHFSIFNVMGGTWLLGLLAGLVDHPALWYIFIVLNGSQGALIFVLQILKPRVWQMLRDKMAGREETSKSAATLMASSSRSSDTTAAIKSAKI